MDHVNSRLEWADVLKALGIIAIYVGHFGKDAGGLYLFVFSYHVPLFFFAAGLFAKVKENQSFWVYLKQQFLRLMVPYLCFLTINVVVYTLAGNSGMDKALDMFKQGLLGVRNHIFAASLWFIPCMFVMSVFYNGICRLVRNKYIMLAIAFILYVVTQTALPSNPSANPSWFWNIDSAMMYMVFYALGAVVFPFLKDFHFKSLKVVPKILVILVSAAAVLFTVGVYFSANLKSILYVNIIPLNFITGILITCILILANLVLAFLLSKIIFLQNLGKSTLILCGTEQIIKLLIPLVCGLVKLKITLTSPLSALIYTLICLTVNYYTLVRLFGRSTLLNGKITLSGKSS